MLSAKEKGQLAQVKTTKKEAKTIKKRNKLLLKFVQPEGIKKALKKMDSHFFHNLCTEIGCPHCIKHDRNCCACEWNYKAKSISTACLVQTFNGISGRKVRCQRNIRLSYMQETESIDFISLPYPVNKDIKKDIADIIKVLEGHIEWADLIISGEIKKWL